MTVYGADISEVNNLAGMSVDWFHQYQFIGIRVFNEHGRLDVAFHTNWANAKAAGVPRLAYGWPIAGRDNTTLGKQLVSTAPDSELGWWADYEHSNAGLASHSELEDYIRACNGGFYSNLSELPRSPFLDSVPWWFANPSGHIPPRPVLIEQYGVVNNTDVNSADDSFLGGNVLSDADKTWIQGTIQDYVLNIVRQEGISGAGQLSKEILDKLNADATSTTPTTLTGKFNITGEGTVSGA